MDVILADDFFGESDTDAIAAEDFFGEPESKKTKSLPPAPAGLGPAQEAAWNQAREAQMAGVSLAPEPYLQGRATKGLGVSEEDYADALTRWTPEQYDTILTAQQDPIEQLPWGVRSAVKGAENIEQSLVKTKDEAMLAAYELSGMWDEARNAKKRRNTNRQFYDERAATYAIAHLDDSEIGQMAEQVFPSVAEYLGVGLSTGGYGVLPYLFNNSARESYYESKEAGLSDTEAAVTAALQGSAETAITATIGKLLGAGIERGLSTGAASIVAQRMAPHLAKLNKPARALVNGALQSGAEGIEEGAVETAKTTINAIMGVPNEGNFSDRFWSSVAGGAMGGAPVGVVTAGQDLETAINKLAEQTQQTVAETTQAIEAVAAYEGEGDLTTRRTFERVTGLKNTTKKFRQEVVDSVRNPTPEVSPEQTQVAPEAAPVVEPTQEPTQETTPEPAPETATAPRAPTTQGSEDIVRSIQAVVPGSVVAATETGLRVELPNGQFLTVESVPDVAAFVDEKSIKSNLAAHNLEDTPENRARLLNDPNGSFVLTTKDGEKISGMGIVRLAHRLNKSPKRMQRTVRHELFHAGHQLGFITDAEFDALRKKYAPKAKTVYEAEEALAEASELWEGERGLTAYLKEMFDRLLAAFGIKDLSWQSAQNVVARGDVFSRQPKNLDQARKDVKTSLTTALSAAWHGSPHTFSEFSTKAMGTGEGAQAFGWGLYFTEREDVADFYREKLSGGQVPTVNTLRDYFQKGRIVNGYSGKDRVVSFNETGDGGWSVTVERVVQDGDGNWVVPPGEYKRTHGTLPSAADIEAVLGKRQGRKYAVDLKPKEDEYLLWDKPLSEQSEKVKAAIPEEVLDEIRQEAGNRALSATNKKRQDQLYDIAKDPMLATGEMAYTAAVRVVGRGVRVPYGSPAAVERKREASLRLLSNGIRGIKYLDGTSRGKGEGSYNYVIFDDKDVEIQHVSLSANTDPDRYLDRANISTDTQARQAMSEHDVAHGPPDGRSREVAAAEAQQRLAADYDGELNRFITGIEKAEAQGKTILMDETDTDVARMLLHDLGIKMLQGDAEARKLHRTLNRGYRDSRSEAARTLGLRDPLTTSTVLTPVERRKSAIAEAMTEDTKDGKKKRRKGKHDEADQQADKDFDRIRDKLKELGWDLSDIDEIAKDPEKTTRLLQDIKTQHSGITDMLYEYWKNAILSGLHTQMVNIGGNFGFSTGVMTVERAGEALVNLFVKDPKGAQLGEFKYMLRGLGPGMYRGWYMALQAWRTESAAFQVAMRRAETQFEQGTTAAIPNKYGGKYVRIPYRMLLFVDEFAKTTTATMEVGVQAYRIAKAEGLKGEAIEQRVAELTNDIDSDAWTLAIDKSVQLAFQGKGGVASQAVQKLGRATRQYPGARWLIPFLTTPANIFEAGLRRTPILGVLLDYADARHNGHKMADSGISATIARQTIAIAGMAILYGMNDPEDPWITGSKDMLDSKKRDIAYRRAPPMSIKIAGKWYSYARIEPFATAIGFTVDMINSDKEGDALVGTLRGGLAQTVDKTYLQSLGDVQKAYEVLKREGTLDGVAEWSSNFAASWVPNIVRQTSRNAREEMAERRVWGKEDEYYDRLARRTIQNTELRVIPDFARYDVWGRPIKNHPSDGAATDMFWRIVSPIKTFDESKVLDVDKAIYRWNAQNPDKAEGWLPIQPYYREKGETHYLTDEQYAEYSRVAGELAFKYVQRIRFDPDNPTESQIEKIVDAVRRGRANARKKLKPSWKN